MWTWWCLISGNGQNIFDNKQETHPQGSSKLEAGQSLYCSQPNTHQLEDQQEDVSEKTGGEWGLIDKDKGKTIYSSCFFKARSHLHVPTAPSSTELLSLPRPASRMPHLHRAMIARGKGTSGESTVRAGISRREHTPLWSFKVTFHRLQGPTGFPLADTRG